MVREVVGSNCDIVLNTSNMYRDLQYSSVISLMDGPLAYRLRLENSSHALLISPNTHSTDCIRWRFRSVLGFGSVLHIMFLSLNVDNETLGLELPIKDDTLFAYAWLNISRDDRIYMS